MKVETQNNSPRCFWEMQNVVSFYLGDAKCCVFTFGRRKILRLYIVILLNSRFLALGRLIFID
jgi:hypothetical protein